jgi:hypothetical protein
MHAISVWAVGSIAIAVGRRVRELIITSSLNRVQLRLEARFSRCPFGLSFFFHHRASDNTARAKILDRTPNRDCEQLDRLCNWIANLTAWLYSSKPILHLRIRVQHAAVAQGTETHKSRSGVGTR